MLELFGSCEALNGQLASFIKTQILRLNWTILPKGPVPWDALKEQIDRIPRTPGSKAVVDHRLKEIRRYEPEFTAIGLGGFTGYLIFGFPTKGIFVLECTRWGNATYIFDHNWQDFSKMTKAEILNNDYQKARLIHVDQWENRLRDLLK